MFFGHNLSKSINPFLLSDGVAAGSGDVQTSSAVDMGGITTGGGAIMFIIALGTVATGGGGLIKIQGSDDNGVADPFVDLQNTGVQYTSTQSGQGVIVDVYRPLKRYLQCVVMRGTGGNTTIQSIVALLYHLRQPPVALGTNFSLESWIAGPGPGTS